MKKPLKTFSSARTITALSSLQSQKVGNACTFRFQNNDTRNVAQNQKCTVSGEMEDAATASKYRFERFDSGDLSDEFNRFARVVQRLQQVDLLELNVQQVDLEFFALPDVDQRSRVQMHDVEWNR